LHCIVQYVTQLHVSALFLGHRQVVVPDGGSAIARTVQ